MKRISWCFLISVFVFLMCNMPSERAYAIDDQIKVVVSIPPLKMILDELVKNHGTVTSLLKPGSSPHTYQPKPGDIVQVESADVLFFINREFDGWITTFQNKNTLETQSMVPEEMLIELDGHSHHVYHDNELDAHFWLDPMIVKSILPKLVEELSAIDQENTSRFESNAENFAKKLDELNETVAASMKPHSGEAVLLFHNSFSYYLRRYDLKLAGAVEPFPGREPSPADLIKLIKLIKKHDVKAIFTEPQLPPTAGKTLSEETGLPVLTLDPVGGYENRETYENLIKYNTDVFLEAFGSKTNH